MPRAIRLGGRAVLHDVAFRRRAGRAGRAVRPERRGQDHPAARARGPAARRPPRPIRAASPTCRRARAAPGASPSPRSRRSGRIPHRRRGTARREARAARRAASRICGPSGSTASPAARRGARCSPARFATEPEVFLLDEPTADLDPAAAHAIMALLRRDRAGRGAPWSSCCTRSTSRCAMPTAWWCSSGGRIVADRPAGEALPVGGGRVRAAVRHRPDAAAAAARDA